MKKYKSKGDVDAKVVVKSTARKVSSKRRQNRNLHVESKTQVKTSGGRVMSSANKARSKGSRVKNRTVPSGVPALAYFMFLPLVCMTLWFKLPEGIFDEKQQDLKPKEKVPKIQVYTKKTVKKEKKVSHDSKLYLMAMDAFSQEAFSISQELFLKAKNDDKKNVRLISKKLEELERLVESRLVVYSAEQLAQDGRYRAARSLLEDHHVESHFKEKSDSLRKVIDDQLFAEDVLFAFANGQGREAMEDIKHYGGGGHDNVLTLIKETLDGMEQAKRLKDRFQFEQAKSKYRHIQKKLEDPSHHYYQLADQNLKELSKDENLAQRLLEHGDVLVMKKNYIMAYEIYEKAKAYDVKKSENKILELDVLPHQLIKKAKEHQKIRPQYSYYALREALAMLREDHEKLKKDIKLKMSTLERILKRDNIKVASL